MPGELHQNLNSGQLSVVHRRVGPIAALLEADDIWIVPAGTVIVDAWVNVITIDSDAGTPDLVLEMVDDDDGASNAVTIVGITDIGIAQWVRMTLATANVQPSTQKRRIRAKVTGEAAVGDHNIDVYIAATKDTTSGEPAAATT